MPEVPPDAETVAVAWARQDPDLAALVSTRVATRLPATPTFPFLRVVLVGGSAALAQVPIAQSLLQWDAFAATAGATRTTPDYAGASLVIRTLAAKAMRAQGVALVPGYLLSMIVTAGPERVEEEDSGYARFRLDTLLWARAT